ncbi:MULTISPECIES: hypothetical protein [unclassified Sphaerospermopsis]|nr:MULTISPECIES: hypothetical protein [unclassified Sphaerospermopsis]
MTGDWGRSRGTGCRVQGEIICIFPVTNHQSPITNHQIRKPALV